MKKGLPVVTAITAVEIGEKTYLLRIHEAVYNGDTPHSLLSDFQLRERVRKLDVVWKKHGGKQSLMLSENLIIELKLKKAMMTFESRLPTDQECETLKDYIIDITMDEPWDPSRYYDEENLETPDSDDDLEHNALNTQTAGNFEEMTQNDPNNYHDHDYDHGRAYLDCFEKITEAELLGHAVQLDIDHSRGIFVRSTTLENILGEIPYKELVGSPNSYSNANFFGQLPETKDLPIASEKLHKANIN